MSQIVKAADQIATVRSLLEKSKTQLAMALPRHITAERMLRVALTSIQKNPTLLECTPNSLLGAVFQAAQLGLMPDGVIGEAYLIPFRNNKKGGVMEVQFMPGYRGLLQLARRSGQISTFTVRAVHERDTFQVELGLNPTLKHRPYEGDDDPGRLTHVYAIARMKDGGIQWDYMNHREVEDIRKRSKSANSGPWVTDYEEMAKKTMIRRIAKLLPCSVEMQTAVTLDEMAERDIPQDLGGLIPTEEAAGVEPAVSRGTGGRIDAETGEITDAPFEDVQTAQVAGPAPQQQPAAQPAMATAAPQSTAPGNGEDLTKPRTPRPSSKLHLV
jgi:recombination protein RecT